MPIRPYTSQINSQRRINAAVAVSMRINEYLDDLAGMPLRSEHIEALKEMLGCHAKAWRDAAIKK